MSAALSQQWPQDWKTQQWPQDWKRSVFISVPKKGNAKEFSNYHTIALISHASKVMLRKLAKQIYPRQAFQTEARAKVLS